MDDRRLQYVLKVVPGIILSLAACVGASGCARNYDGTIVPSYTAEMVSDGGPARMEYRKTDLLPPNRLYEFPPPPPSPAGEEAERQNKPQYVRAPRRRAASHLVPRVPMDMPQNAKCHNEAGEGGRVRVVCL